MKEIVLSLLLGISFGAILTGFYFDGFVANDYKDKLKIASDGLKRAQGEIDHRDEQIIALSKLIIQLMKDKEETESIFKQCSL